MSDLSHITHSADIYRIANERSPGATWKHPVRKASRIRDNWPALAPRSHSPEPLRPVQMVIAATCVALAAVAGASIVAKGIANKAHFDATHIMQGNW